MAYFNHAFNKVFLGTGGYTAGANPQALTPTQFGLIAPNQGNILTANYTTISTVNLATTVGPLVLVSGGLYQRDKIGPFHGGYDESNKSKIINPKYVSSIQYVPPVAAQQHTISVGVTPANNPGGTPAAGCQKDFMCGENYYLRVDLKGSPELRFLSRNSYYTAMAYTGCCANPTSPTPVDPTTVYIQWAKALMDSPLIAPFISISIYNTANNLVGVAYNKTTYDAAVAAGTLAWDLYTPVLVPTAGMDAGMYIQGAYVDSQFGNCTFYPTDALQAYLEPIKIYASEVDYNGDPCAFASLCVTNTCNANFLQGSGEVILRELILSEGYRQSPFYTGRDLRIREITQGDQLANLITRSSTYHRYYITHSVPRFNNPTGTFDNDQYVLEIITAARLSGAGSFETGLNGWLANNGNASVTVTANVAPSACATAIPAPSQPNPSI